MVEAEEEAPERGIIHILIAEDVKTRLVILNRISGVVTAGPYSESGIFIG